MRIDRVCTRECWRNCRRVPRREREMEVPCMRCVAAWASASGAASTSAPRAASTGGKGKPSSSVIGVGVGVVNFASASARKACLVCSLIGALSSRMRAGRVGGSGGMRSVTGARASESGMPRELSAATSPALVKERGAVVPDERKDLPMTATTSAGRCELDGGTHHSAHSSDGVAKSGELIAKAARPLYGEPPSCEASLTSLEVVLADLERLRVRETLERAAPSPCERFLVPSDSRLANACG
jgi:hypothetical protein